MAKIGYTLYCEGNDPRDLIQQAVLAEQAGFDFLVISDHYHPWLTNQKHAGFAWTILGAVAQATKKIKLATMVTCPIVRYHPAIVAQMAATVGVISGGRFTLGLGAGERLNEHVVGKGWPAVTERHEMLAEVIDIIRELWKGDYVNFAGKHYKVEDAKVFDLPEKPIELFVAAGGPKAAELAANKGDGVCITDADEKLIKTYREAGGNIDSMWAQSVLGWGRTEDEGAQYLYDQFRFSAGGWKVQSELPNPVNFDASVQNMKPEDMKKSGAVGPKVDGHKQAVQKYLDLGITHLALAYPGPDTEGFMEFWKSELQPAIDAK